MSVYNCVYCKKSITFANMRCESCNLIWNEGVDFGKELIKSDLRNIAYEFQKLIKEDIKK